MIAARRTRHRAIAARSKPWRDQVRAEIRGGTFVGLDLLPSPTFSPALEAVVDTGLTLGESATISQAAIRMPARKQA
jgi:hypothetical protein